MDELVEHWTVLDDERNLVLEKRGGAQRLGFALVLKFYTLHGRFPRGRAEFSDEVVEFVARQVKVSGAEFGLYEWAGRTIGRHRGQIRAYLGFRECSVADADKFAVWLTTDVAHAERNADRVREELLKRLREEFVEPPAPDRVTRMVRSALHNAEENWFLTVWGRVPDAVRCRVLALVGEDGDEESMLALVKSLPGNMSLESMLREIRKLRAIRAVGLPAGLFADVAPKVVAGWRPAGRGGVPVASAPPSPQSRLTLLGALLVRAGAGDHRHAGGPADRHGAPDRRAGGEEGHRRAGQRVQEGDRQGEHPLPDRRGVAGAAGRRRSARSSSRRCRAASRRCGSWCTSSRPRDRSTGARCRPTLQGVLHQPLPARADHAAGGAGVPVEQHRPPARDRGAGADQPVRERRGTPPTTRSASTSRCTGASRGRLGGGGVPEDTPRPAAGGADGLRGRDLPGAARAAAVQGDLGARRRASGATRTRTCPRDFEASRAEHYGELRKPLDPRVFVDELREEMTAELVALNDAIGRAGLAGHRRRRKRARSAAPGLDAAARAAQPAHGSRRRCRPALGYRCR